MKKFIIRIMVLALFVLIVAGTNVYAVDFTLDEVVSAFNNSETVQDYATKGAVWEATNLGDTLVITATSNGETTTLTYAFEDPILSAEFSKEDAFAGSVISMALEDSIGQLHGYASGELNGTLSSDEIWNYTVENEGFEIRETETGGCQVKLDINKKIPLADLSNVYITVEHLETLKEYIAGDGSAELSKGNVWFHKDGYDGDNTVLIAEKDALTSNAYKSLLSVIEVMFNSKEIANYFAANYLSIAEGNKEFIGFKIEINPVKDEWEKQLMPETSGYEFARVTIDKKQVTNLFDIPVDTNEPIATQPGNGDNNPPVDTTTGATNNSPADSGAATAVTNTIDNTVSKDKKIPQTGGESLIHTIIKYMIILISLILVGMAIVDTKKGKN